MNKNNHLKLFFLLILLSVSLFGCFKGDSQNAELTIGETPTEVDNPDTDNLNNTPIGEFYEKNFKYALREGFLDKLKEPADKKLNDKSIKSNYADKTLEEMKTIVRDFRVSDLSKIEKPEDKKQAIEILDRIDQHLVDMSDKVIVPLKDGLTKEAVTEVQKQLDFFAQRNLNSNLYGNFGTITYEEIEKFLNDKQTDLDKEIKALNTIVNLKKVSDNDSLVKSPTPTIEERLAQLEEEVKQIQEENYFFKSISIGSIIIALISIIVVVPKKNIDILSKFIRLKRSSIGQNNENNNFSQNINESQPRSTYPGTRRNYPSTNPTVTEDRRRSTQHSGEQTQRVDQRANNRSSSSRSRDRDPVTLPTYPMQVSLQKESRRHGSSETFILEENPQGNYIVHAERNTEYLSISKNIRIDENNYEEISSLFDCDNYNPNYPHEFELKKRAKVNIMNTGQGWQLQLQNLGTLQLTPIQPPPTYPMLVSLKVGYARHGGSILESNPQGNYIVNKERNSESLTPRENIRIDSNNYEEINNLFECPNYDSNYSHTFKVIEPAKVNTIDIGRSWQLQRKGILELTRIQPPPTNGTPVSETEKSASDRRLGKSKIVVLEKKRRGNYLVYTHSGYECLVPSQHFRLNQYNYKTIEGLFECRNYNPSLSKNFEVVQPALLNSISSGETWELKQRGILQF